jgi:hypothetical protein
MTESFNRNSIASLVCALAGPPAILGLEYLLHAIVNDIPESVDALVIVAAFVLCPLAAAFLGHAARLQIRKNGGADSVRGYTLAGVGLTLGYLELACWTLLFIGLFPRHSNQIAVDESAAVGALRTINDAEYAYSEAHPKSAYTKRLQDLNGDSGQVWFIDHALASGVKSDYKFTYVPHLSKQDGVVDEYQVFADPIDSPDAMRHFFTDQTGVIRYTRNTPANESSNELQ